MVLFLVVLEHLVPDIIEKLVADCFAGRYSLCVVYRQHPCQEIKQAVCKSCCVDAVELGVHQVVVLRIYKLIPGLLFEV